MDVSGLNAQQQEAVTAPLQPVLVLAGAGSGKTRVLTYRIAYIIEQQWAAPDSILALTFTNKAAKEMRDRVMALLSETGKVKSEKLNPEPLHFPLSTFHSSVWPTMGTFHALGVRMLRQFGYVLGLPKLFPIFDGDDRLKVVKDIFKDEQFDEVIDPRMASYFIHTIKNSGEQPPAAAERYPKPIAHRLVRVYELYQNSLQAQGAVDLDDLLLLPLRLLRDFPEVKRYYQQLFTYILVDEYQDTNPIQYQFLRELAPPASLFVVGDDAQAIYGFRGSDISNILHFEKDFPNARVITLEQNYRSTQHILNVAGSVLRHSPQQLPKSLWTENEHGPRVVVKELPTDLSEADYIVNRIIAAVSVEGADGGGAEGGMGEITTDYEGDIADETRPFSVLDYILAGRRGGSALIQPRVKQLPKEHRPLSEFAVLYRTHAQSRALEAALMQAAVPYRIVGGLRFFDRKEVKDALSYLRVLLRIKDFVALSRVVSTPPRGIGDKTLAVLKSIVLGAAASEPDFGELERALGQAPARSRTVLLPLFQLFQGFQAIPEDFSLDRALERILQESGLFAYYKQEDGDAETRQENLRELVSVARRFSAEPWKEALPKFLEEVALMNEVDGVSEDADALTLMTLHAAKGLEFDTVYLAGLEEGLLPHSRSLLDPKQLAEEVRLLYVGITRARKALTITFVRQRGMFGDNRVAAPSRFLRELSGSSVDWQGSRPQVLSPAVEHGDNLRYEPFEE
ncbi:MAG: UvrD-helicase domain-containing protein [Candidatus Doudnabacteria bacterium]|nr:UvrD-helicase domain-containing protein [Candidatus Doudnabacteria bacterium]